jgi:hypothetical protein
MAPAGPENRHALLRRQSRLGRCVEILTEDGAGTCAGPDIEGSEMQQNFRSISVPLHAEPRTLLFRPGNPFPKARVGAGPDVNPSVPTINPNNAQSTARFDDDRAGIRAFTFVRTAATLVRWWSKSSIRGLPPKRVASAPNATHVESHVYGCRSSKLDRCTIKRSAQRFRPPFTSSEALRLNGPISSEPHQWMRDLPRGRAIAVPDSATQECRGATG